VLLFLLQSHKGLCEKSRLVFAKIANDIGRTVFKARGQKKYYPNSTMLIAKKNHSNNEKELHRKYHFKTGAEVMLSITGCFGFRHWAIAVFGNNRQKQKRQI